VLTAPSEVVVDPDVDGGAETCQNAAELAKRRVLGPFGTEAYGLVRDGVARVELTFPNRHVSLSTRNNYWQCACRRDPSAVNWKDAQGNDIDAATPRNAASLSAQTTYPKVDRTELHIPVTVLPGHRIRFTPPSGRHRYEISLACGKPNFDGAVTKGLPREPRQPFR